MAKKCTDTKVINLQEVLKYMQLRDLLVILLLVGYFLFMRKPSEFLWLTDILMGLAAVLVLVKCIVSFKNKE